MSDPVDALRDLLSTLRAALSDLADLSARAAAATNDDERMAVLTAWRSLLAAAGVAEPAEVIPDVGALLTDLDKALAEGAEFTDVLAALAQMPEHVANIVTAFSALQLQPDVSPEDFAARLIEAIVLRELYASAPASLAILEAAQLVTTTAGRQHLDFDNAAKLLSRPGEYLNQLFGPPAFADVASTRALADRVLRPLARLPLGGASVFYGSDVGPSAPPFLLFKFGDFIEDADVRFAVAIAPVPTSAGGPAFRISAEGHGEVSFPIGETLSATIGVDAPNAVSMRLGLDGSVSFSAGAPKIRFDFQQAGDARWVLGDSNGVRLEVGGLAAGLSIAAEDAGFHADVKSGKLVLRAPDGFIREAIPDSIEVPFSIGADWTWKSGLRFRGGAGLSVRLPFRLDLGPASFEDLEVDLSLGAGDGGFALQLGVRTSIGLHIGPVSATVEGLGVGAALTAPGAKRNLGFAELAAPSILSPTGVGLSIDAGPVRGGGYLSIRDGIYTGVGTLKVQAGVELTLDIVLIITTARPDAPPDVPRFSLLALASVEFSPGVALFAGFFLGGLGLLLGVNRAMNPEALRAGVKTGLLRSLLFPENPVANAAQVTENLGRAFPAQNGRYVLGALAKITYGTGEATIFEADLGLAVQIGGPFVLAVLAQFRLRWPRAEGKEILVINLDCVGVWDSGKGTLSIDASLVDSRILTWPLTGDAALRAGGQEGFLLSIGGFHPAFRAPPSFPKLERLALTMSMGDIARLRVETYTAITSNTFQIGARAEAVIDLRVCKIEGHIAFDALVELNPFHFEVDLDATFALSVAGHTLLGLHVDLHVSGPNTWHLSGHVSVTILCFDIHVGFDATFGEQRAPDALPTVDAPAVLASALGKASAWSSSVPADVGALLPLAPLTPPGGASPVLVHPLGDLAVRQRDLPIDVEIDRVGPTRLAARAALRIRKASVSGGGDLQVAPVQELFAAAQYIDMPDADKLARPSFEPFDAGAVLSVAQSTESAAVERQVTYDVIGAGSVATGSVTAAAAAAMVASDAPPPAPAPRVVVKERSYAVASRADLTRAGDTPAASTFTHAQQAARRLAGASPALRRKLQIVGAEEVVE
jgi:hypothetical protein